MERFLPCPVLLDFSILFQIFCQELQEEVLTVKRRNSRGSYSKIFFRIGVLENFAIFTGKHLCCSVGVSFNKIAGLQACNSIKKRLQHSCFPVNIEKFFNNSFSYRTAPVTASGIQRFFLFAIYATLKIYEDSQYDTNIT